AHCIEFQKQFFSLRYRSCCVWVHANKLSETAFVFKVHYAVNQSKQGVILTATHVAARFPFGPALARENVTAKHALAAELLESQSLGIRVTSVSGRTYTFLMSHFVIFDLRLPICDLSKAVSRTSIKNLKSKNLKSPPILSIRSSTLCIPADAPLCACNVSVASF